MPIGGYIISEAADNDLEDIFDYTLSKFGLGQTLKYISDLENLFSMLSVNPEMGKPRNEIKSELRSFPYGTHIIFYRMLNTNIRILRILHTSRDIPQFFE